MINDKLYNKRNRTVSFGWLHHRHCLRGTVIGIFCELLKLLFGKGGCVMPLIFRDPPTFGSSAPLALAR
jgi:hypothetical protein